MLVVIAVIAEPAAKVFTKDLNVINYTVTYLRILLVGSIGMNLYSWNGQALNAVGKSIWSLVINGGYSYIYDTAVVFRF